MTRQGQPRKTRAPMAAMTPSRKRTAGAEPPRARYSPKQRAAAREPSTMPMISGRRYWTMGARCRPTAPAMSRLKQTTQMPMLPGLPENCKKTAIRPRRRPVTTMPVVDEKKLKLFFMRPPRDGMRQKLKDARRSVTDLGDGGPGYGEGQGIRTCRRRDHPAALHTVKPVALRQVWCMGMAVSPWVRQVGMDKSSLGKEQGRVKCFREKRGQAGRAGAGPA